MKHKLSRRNFMKLGVGTGVALVVGVSLQGSNTGKSIINNKFKPDIWISVDPDNTISITITESEMGQGDSQVRGKNLSSYFLRVCM